MELKMSRLSTSSTRSASVMSRKSNDRVVETHDDLRNWRERRLPIEADMEPLGRSITGLSTNAGVQTQSLVITTDESYQQSRISRSALIRKVQRDHERSKKAYREKNYDDMFKSDEEDEIMREYLDSNLLDAQKRQRGRPKTTDQATHTGSDLYETQKRQKSAVRSGSTAPTDPDVIVEDYLSSILTTKKSHKTD